MSRLLQTVSVLSFAAALSAAPMAIAQQTQPAEQPTQQTTQPAVETQTESEAGQAVDSAAQEAEEAAQEAGQAAEQATESAGQAAEQAGDKAAEGAEQAAEGAEEAAEGAEEAAEGAAETTEEAVEAESPEPVTEPATGTAAAPATGTTGEPVEAEVVEGEEAAEPVQGAITLQDADSILASDLIGATVYNAQAEDVGEINDAIVGLGGTIEGVVIGVGGFLGLGEKDVAVQMSEISVQQDESGNPQLIIDTTRESLEAAPEFMTADEQAAEAQSTAVPSPAGGTGATGGMAPADPAAGGAGTTTGGGTGTPTQ